MSRKTDNDSMLQVQEKPEADRQLSFLRFVPKEQEKPSNPLGDRLTAEYKQQELAALAIAQELYPDHGFTRTRDMPTPMFCEIWNEYHRRNPRPQPLEIPCNEDESLDAQPVKKPKKPKQYQEWSIERKWQWRLGKVHERIKKRYSFIDLYVSALQDEVISNPQYFGVCPLPGAIEASKLNLQDLLPNPAKEYERALRAQEILEYEIKYEGKQALLIPVELKEKELVEVTYSTHA